MCLCVCQVGQVVCVYSGCRCVCVCVYLECRCVSAEMFLQKVGCHTRGGWDTFELTCVRVRVCVRVCVCVRSPFLSSSCFLLLFVSITALSFFRSEEHTSA